MQLVENQRIGLIVFVAHDFIPAHLPARCDILSAGETRL
jgi:hypothetical protein